MDSSRFRKRLTVTTRWPIQFVRRGVSLIEAVVALAVMATGLLGVVGVQATLRANSDVAKQRAEGVRLAQQKLEDARFFRGNSGAAPAYDGIPVGIQVETFAPAQQEAGPYAGAYFTNTTFTRTTVVTAMDTRVGAPDLQAVPRAKSIAVTVSWSDRAGQRQSVTLNGAVAGIAPALAGSLAVPPDGGTVVRLPNSRSTGIPIGAKNLGDGSSVWKPPVADGTVAWRFNNADGLITRCRVAVTDTTDSLTVDRLVGACNLGNARFVGGYVRYALNRTQPSNADALQPGTQVPPVAPLVEVRYTTLALGAPAVQQCFTETVSGSEAYTAYYCAIPVVVTVDDPTPSWSGTIVFRNNGNTSMATSSTDSSSERLRACRYAATLESYTRVREPLSSQNFLFIRAGDAPVPPILPLDLYNVFRCPAPSTVLFQPIP